MTFRCRHRMAIVLIIAALFALGCQGRDIVRPVQSTSAPAVTSTPRPQPLPTEDSSTPRTAVIPTAVANTRPSIDPSATPVQNPPNESPSATRVAELEQPADITLNDTGKTFTYRVTERFMVFLDDNTYPLSDLHCDPEGIIGFVSNGSVNGPDNYPIMFEAVQPGECRLQNNDFRVHIIVKPL